MNIISRFFLYLFGTLTLRLNGDYCERLLNIMAAHNISFWKPIRKNENLFITIMTKDIKKIRLLRRHTGVKIKIIKRSGFPLIYNRYKRRYGLVLGILMFFVIVNFLSGRMWMIKINGNVNVTYEEINTFFESCGVKPGVAMSRVDSDILKQKLILSFDNIAWASVNKQGSVIEVNITEFTSERDNETPCNIVSQYDAVVKKVNVSKGSVSVKIGDTVTKNQILVSGIVNYGAGNSFVHSNGEIIAEIHFNRTVSVNKVQENSSPTGKKVSRIAIDTMGLRIPLFLGSVNGVYEKNETYEYMHIFGGEIPIIIHKAEYTFINKTYTDIDEDTAKNLSSQKLLSNLKEMGAENIKTDILRVHKTGRGYEFDYDVVCLLDIGREVPIKTE